MTENRHSKLNREEKLMISKLQSGRLSLIIEVLKEIKQSGSVRLIPYLFEIIASGRFTRVEDEIIRLISDIKERDAVPYIVESIKKYNFGDKTAGIIAICWQSRLDFSAYLPEFTGFFFQNDYQTSIEAFTVIEESLHNATCSQKEECLKILERDSSKVSESLRPLYSELRKLVKSSLDMTSGDL
ncbi:MAG: hypothetical protein JW723_14835 [Bacteroidales bacterium]|nr:hypothetical protein [Bacteroidales bacterium]